MELPPDEGVRPVGLCAVVGVDVGLELVDEPVQGVLAFAVEVAVLLIVEAGRANTPPDAHCWHRRCTPPPPR